MADSRTFPDIDFVDTDADTIKNRFITKYEALTGRTLYPADPIRILLLWLAGMIVQERVEINQTAKQNVPRFAEGENLDSLSENFHDVSRLEASAATTTLCFTLSQTLDHAQLIPEGTRATVDGSIIFGTTEALYIPVGSLTGDVSAVCETVGTDGNDFLPGQINQIIDPFPYFSSVANTTESDGGTDAEDDNSFYERLRESEETYSTAGPEEGYVYYAKSASSKIIDVSVNQPSPGIVDLRILLDGGKLPTDEMIQKVENTLTTSKARPLTDNVTVASPDTVSFNMEATYYIPASSASSSTTIEAAVADAVQEYITWQTAKLGRDINPSYFISLLMAAGIKRVEVTQPVYTVVAGNAVAVLETQSVESGGTEDE